MRAFDSRLGGVDDDFLRHSPETAPSAFVRMVERRRLLIADKFMRPSQLGHSGTSTRNTFMSSLAQGGALGLRGFVLDLSPGGYHDSVTAKFVERTE
jgi:hypothetical protein